MPLYEYRCRDCDTVFEARRSMSEASAPAPCPSGHDDTVRLLSVFASTGRAGSAGAPAMAGAPAAPCRASCACHPG